jgi:hypothetical protein
MESFTVYERVIAVDKTNKSFEKCTSLFIARFPVLWQGILALMPVLSW